MLKQIKVIKEKYSVACKNAIRSDLHETLWSQHF